MSAKNARWEGSSPRALNAEKGPALLFESDRYKFRYAHFFHRHAIKRARGFHRALVVCDDDELGVCGHSDDFISEAADVCFIERSIDFVEQAERRGAIMEYSENEREGGHGFFTA